MVLVGRGLVPAAVSHRTLKYTMGTAFWAAPIFMPTYTPPHGLGRVGAPFPIRGDE